MADSFAAQMVALLQDALVNHPGLTSIRHPNGAQINYESRTEMIKALRKFQYELALETNKISGTVVRQNIKYGKTR